MRLISSVARDTIIENILMFMKSIVDTVVENTEMEAMVVMASSMFTRESETAPRLYLRPLFYIPLT